MTRIFLLYRKVNDPQTLKVAAAKSLFSSVYIIGTTCFDEYFSFYVVSKMITFSESSSLL